MAVVDFPDPDSPMMETVSPAAIRKLTPSTARTTPCAVSSSIWRSSTSRSGRSAAVPASAVTGVFMT